MDFKVASLASAASLFFLFDPYPPVGMIASILLAIATASTLYFAPSAMAIGSITISLIVSIIFHELVLLFTGKPSWIGQLFPSPPVKGDPILGEGVAGEKASAKSSSGEMLSDTVTPACSSRCGSDPICLGSCASECKVSYCINLGKKTVLTRDNCVEHQRALAAATLSDAPGAKFCREWHSYHGPCIVCSSNGNECTPTASCEDGELSEERLRQVIAEKDESVENYYMTEEEKLIEWTRNAR